MCVLISIGHRPNVGLYHESQKRGFRNAPEPNHAVGNDGKQF